MNPTMLRIPGLILAALLINAIIFGVIQYMVGSPRIRLNEAQNFDIANFIRMQEQSQEVRSRRDPKAPQKPMQEQQQQLNQLAQANVSSTGLTVDIPDLDFDVGLSVGGGIEMARELIPLVRIPPEYPQRALARQIEGYVILRFTITETGSVVDPKILRAEPDGFFELAAIRAVQRWKYQPQMRDGKPVQVSSLTRVTFMIDRGDM